MRPLRLLSCATIAGVVLGCSPKVKVPPLVDLKGLDTIGFIEFSTNAEGNLGPFVSQEFIHSIQSAQPGVRILELGDEVRVLNAVGFDEMGPEAVAAVGREYNVGAVFVGHLEVSKVEPKVNISTLLSSMRVSAEVEATLRAKLLETADGATVWTQSARDKKTVANITMLPGGVADFNARDPEEAYGDLVQSLIRHATVDFRARYERR